MLFTSLHPSAADLHPEPGTGSPGQLWVAMAAAGPESARQLRPAPTTSRNPLPAPLQTRQLDRLHSSGHAPLVLGVPWVRGDRAGGGGDGNTGTGTGTSHSVPSQAAVPLNGAAAPPTHQSINPFSVHF